MGSEMCIRDTSFTTAVKNDSESGLLLGPISSPYRDSKELIPLIRLREKRSTEEIRNTVHNIINATPCPSSKPNHSVGAKKDRKELPFQNECPAMDRDIAGIILLGVWMPEDFMVFGDLT